MANNADVSEAVLLQVSGCIDVVQLSRVASQTPLDPLTIIAHAPECIEVDELADLLSRLVTDSTCSKRALLPVSSVQWVEACIARAEAIDQWTGRLDWAKRWLEQVRAQKLYDITDAQPLDRALRNAHVLGLMLELGRPVGLTLAIVNSMPQAEFVSWVMRECCADTELSPVLIRVAGYMEGDAELRSAWNAWWAQNMLATPHSLMPALIRSYPDCFDSSVVLAAVYLVVGPCSSLGSAKVALEAVASLLGVTSLGAGIEFEQPVYEILSGSSENEMCDALCALSDDEVAAVVNAGLAQIRAAEILACFGLDIDMPAMTACQGSGSDQHKLLLRLLASAERHQDARAEELSLWSSLLQLHGMKLLSQLSVNDVKQEYLRMLLSSEQFEEARMLLDAEPLFTENVVVRQTACEVARELFDNADMCSMDKGAMKAVRMCLDVVPGPCQQDPDVKRERALVDVVHLVWTLGASALPLFQSQRAGLAASGGIHPIEIRLAKDPYTLIKRVLDSYPGAYKKQRIVREISGKLFEIAALAGAPVTDCDSPDPDLGNATRRDLGVRSISEGFIAALMLQSAVDAKDYTEGYNFARQLVNARSVLSKALRTVEAHRSARMLADVDSSGGMQPVEVRAVGAIWTSCVNLARAWSAQRSASNTSAIENQQQVVSLALSLCPIGEIAELLRLWNAIQQKVVGGSQSNAASAPWTLPASSCDDPVMRVRQVLIGHQSSADNESASSDAQSVDPESMRTFDPAIIMRCLRLTAASTARQSFLQSVVPDQRCNLLMVWLEFALTTAKEPTSDTGVRYRQKVEADIVRNYPQAACDTLASRVLPQIDCTNYVAMEAFYTFYAACLESSGDVGGSKQAQTRAVIIQSIKQSAVLDGIDFAQLVRAMTAPKSECRLKFGLILSETTAMPLVELAPDLVKLSYLPLVDSCDSHGPSSGGGVDAWSSSELTSKLCLWMLEDVLRSGLAKAQDDGDSLSYLFQRLLAVSLSALSGVADLTELTGLVAFDSDIADALGLACRLEASTWCLNRAAQTEDQSDLPSLVKLKGAHAYLVFLSEIETLRDPFTFTKLPSCWARAFDVASGAFVLDGSGSGEDVCTQCLVVLGDMVADEVAAYFVCQAYMSTKRLVSQWEDSASSIPGLAQVYIRALCRVAGETSDADVAFDEIVARRVVAVAEPPLELCSFEYGDNALGEVLAQFRSEFGASLSDIVHGKHPGVLLGNAAKLALLDLMTRLCSPDLHRVVSEGDDISERATKGLGDIGDSDFLQFQLLADKLWGFALPDSGGRDYGQLSSAWLRLLELTDSQIASADGQVDTLVQLLVKWAGIGLDVSRSEGCWAALLKWAVRNKRPARVVVALVNYPGQFTPAVGALVFDEILDEVQGTPTMAASLAVLGLAYPDRSWAEQCMEHVIYVMISATIEEPVAIDQAQIPAAELAVSGDEEEDDPWAIDDVPLDDEHLATTEKVLDSDALVHECSSAIDPEELALARDTILSSASLHLAIMIHGYVSACLASPPLLAALGDTLLRGQDRLQHKDCRALLSAPMLAREKHGSGIEPVHELFRRTVHTVADIGMGETALGWVYEFLGVPALYRYLYRKRTVAMWLAHLDRVVLGEEDVCKVAAHEQHAGVAEPGPEPEPEPKPEPEPEPEVGWGESDVDLDDFRDYEFNLSHKPFGHSGLWSLYKATTRAKAEQTATVWVFDKRYFERGLSRQLLTVRDQGTVIELLKTEASQLTRLRHPSVLQVIEPLEESRGSLMFVTEQVLASLDDLVSSDSRRHGLGTGYRVDGDVFDLDDFEIQKGLLQISKVLKFLHDDAKIVHGNLVPASVLLNTKGDWKLGGFGFAQTHGQHGGAGGEYQYDYQMSADTQRRLDFMAPEVVFEGKCTHASDLFSLGCLATATYFDGRSPLDCRNDVNAYRRQLDGLRSSDAIAKVPEELRAPILALLAVDPLQRMSLDQFQRSPYFDDILVASLRYLEALAEQPMEQKIAFMRGLPRVLANFPDRVLRRKVLPALLDQTSDHALLPYTLPNVFYIVDKLEAESFAAMALPGLKKVFGIADPLPETSIVVLDHMPLLQRKARAEVFRSDVLPVVYAALMSSVPQVQDKALAVVPGIADSMDFKELKDQVLPRVQHLYTKANVLSRKVCALKCLHGMMKPLGEQTIVEHIIPLLRRTKTQEHSVIMAMLEMYEEMGTLYVDRSAVAKEILPALWAQAMSSRLKVSQFKRVVQAIRKLEERVEREQLAYLEKMDRGSAGASAAVEASDAWGFNDDEDDDSGAVMSGDVADTRFVSLVMSGGGLSPQRTKAAPLPNPLAETRPAKASEWEWDASTFGSARPGAGKGSLVAVEADSAVGKSDDEFGSFGSYVPAPRPATSSKAPLASRLRTTAPLASSHHSANRLGGATKLGSAGGAAPLPLPPPPSSSRAISPPVRQANYGANGAFANMHVASSPQTSAAVPMLTPLAPLAKPGLSPPLAALSSQKHVGGKAANLGEFDPFA
ncbi:Protein kinase domain-containing protein ppk32 [Coemansia sp. BCRC 34301]|nr:Protein kinase domain-containing protein ppk32 [Coemansia sp. BCRC 34301]